MATEARIVVHFIGNASKTDCYVGGSLFSLHSALTNRGSRYQTDRQTPTPSTSDGSETEQLWAEHTRRFNKRPQIDVKPGPVG